MNDRVSKRLEAAANVSIAIVALMIGVSVIKSHISSVNLTTEPLQNRGPRVGEKLSLDGVNWAGNHQTLLIILSKGCRFCAESAEFYRKLTALAATRSDLKLIAVFSHDVGSGASYLEEIGVPLRDVIQAAPASLGIKGTPALLLVDEAGAVKESWFGRLASETEAEVISRLGCESCND